MADTIRPAELLDYLLKSIKGIIIRDVSSFSHTVIIARSLNLPLVTRIDSVLSIIDEGNTVIVDGDNGQVFVRPYEHTLQSFKNVIYQRQKHTEKFFALRRAPAITQDGKRIALNMNANFLADLYNIRSECIEGVGLYRTELIFMTYAHFPSVEDQRKIYKQAIQAAKGLRIRFRTLDIGGDKILSYMRTDRKENNPNMGWRSLRISLDRPFIFREQLRALLMASQGRSLDVLFPFVTTAEEFHQAYDILYLEKENLIKKNIPHAEKINIGLMIEVPNIIWQLPLLAKKIDFVSIGTNDLFQFLFAYDRDSPLLDSRYDVLSAGFLNCMKYIKTICQENKINVSVCGEAAGDPLMAMALIGLGFDDLSMNQAALGKIKMMIRSMHYEDVRQYIEFLLSKNTSNIREKLRNFASEQNIKFYN